MGWKVITIWECQLKSRNREKTLLALDLTLGVILLSLYSISGSTKTLPQE